VLDTRNFTGEIGYAVVDLATGEMLDAHLPDRGFPPASVIKLVTALYGLDTLGPGRRFETRLIASGEIANGVLKGDLCLQGGGDPELDSDDLAELAKQAAALGLTRVEGRFLVDATVLPTLDRIDADQPVYVAYNPSVSGVNLNFNRVLFEWARGAKDLTLQARALGVSPAVNTVSISDAPSVHGVFDYRQTPGMETWMVARSALKREGKRWLPVRRPVAHAADVFRTLAAGAGVMLPPGEAGAAPAGGRVLARVASRPLRDMTRLMLKHSTNLTAEAIGLSASRARGRPVADLAASGREMADWARDYVGVGVGVGAGVGAGAGIGRRASARSPGALFAAEASERTGDAMRFANHSGLTPDSRITPQQLVRILRTADQREGTALRDILKPLDLKARKGETGPARPAHGWAKTGTMNFVTGLGGYIDAASGRRLAFAIFAEDLERREAAGMGRERPRGARTWLARTRRMERKLTLDWAARY
jgi:D-alanyl-D-alanine carboxypeptidase/D-alanyl-D-alanine-endopeptidase (penicillin-binding protein 4)